VAARSAGGGIKVDGGGAIVTKSGARTTLGRGRQWRVLRLRSRQRRALKLGTRQQRALGPGSRTAGGISTDGRRQCHDGF
jgi:hypothetical protein